MIKLFIASLLVAFAVAGCAPYVESKANCFEKASFLPNEECKFEKVGT